MSRLMLTCRTPKRVDVPCEVAALAQIQPGATTQSLRIHEIECRKYKRQEVIFMANTGDERRMVVIAPISLEEALVTRSPREPSARVLRTRRLEEDAEAVVQAIKAQGAASITVDEKEDTAAHYLAGLRSALQRAEYFDILLQKKRGQPQIVAWEARPEDAARIEVRRKVGTRLGQIAKARAAAAKSVPKARRGRPRGQ